MPTSHPAPSSRANAPAPEAAPAAGFEHAATKDPEAFAVGSNPYCQHRAGTEGAR